MRLFQVDSQVVARDQIRNCPNQDPGTETKKRQRNHSDEQRNPTGRVKQLRRHFGAKIRSATLLRRITHGVNPEQPYMRRARKQISQKATNKSTDLIRVARQTWTMSSN